jgi:hypothetical protein
MMWSRYRNIRRSALISSESSGCGEKIGSHQISYGLGIGSIIFLLGNRDGLEHRRMCHFQSSRMWFQEVSYTHPVKRVASIAPIQGPGTSSTHSLSGCLSAGIAP